MGQACVIFLASSAGRSGEYADRSESEAVPALPALIQLELELEEELPAIEARRIDWLEIQIMRGWRSAQIRPALAGLDDDLL